MRAVHFRVSRKVHEFIFRRCKLRAVRSSPFLGLAVDEFECLAIALSRRADYEG